LSTTITESVAKLAKPQGGLWVKIAKRKSPCAIGSRGQIGEKVTNTKGGGVQHRGLRRVIWENQDKPGDS